MSLDHRLLEVHEILILLFGRNNHVYFTLLGILHFPVLCHEKYWGKCAFFNSDNLVMHKHYLIEFFQEILFSILKGTMKWVNITFCFRGYINIYIYICELTNNSWRKHKRDHGRKGVCIPRYRILLIFTNFNFDFLALYKMYFQNYFAYTSLKLESFTSHLQHSNSHPYCISYTTLAFGSCLYIEITSWLVSAYDFYSRVVKDR